LACPRCQQTDPAFWASCPVVPSNRDMAIAGAAPAAAVSGDPSAGGPVAEGISRAASGYPLASRRGLEWHHESPAAGAMPEPRWAERPASASVPVAWS